MNSKNFVFTLSIEEWNTIEPKEVHYKINDPNRPSRISRSYYVLPKNQWSPILAEHFWMHTNLPCCISFRRASVFNDGYKYVKITGRCTICGSHFTGTISERPVGTSR